MCVIICDQLSRPLCFPSFRYVHTEMFLSFLTDRTGHQCRPQIRQLLPEGAIWSGSIHCLPYFLHLLDTLLYGTKTIRLFNGCEVLIENFITRVTVVYHKVCRVMPNSDPQGRILLSTPNNHDRFFFLHTFWSPMFDFNAGVPIKSRSYTNMIFSWAQIGRSTTFGREVGVPDREIFSWQKIFNFSLKNRRSL